MDTTRLIAIWGQSDFPHYLGGEVTQWKKVEGNHLGAVETKEFGKGYWFRPLIVVPYEMGREILDNLKALNVEYKAKKDELHEVYMKKLRKII